MCHGDSRLHFMASISCPTSRSVRCSRDRYSALDLRLGNLAGADCTVNFSLSGAPKVRCAAAAIASPQASQLCILWSIYSLSSVVIYDAHDRANPFSHPAATTLTGTCPANRNCHLTQRPANERLRFSVEVSAAYHDWRQTSYETAARFVKAATLLGAT